MIQKHFKRARGKSDSTLGRSRLSEAHQSLLRTEAHQRLLWTTDGRWRDRRIGKLYVTDKLYVYACNKKE